MGTNIGAGRGVTCSPWLFPSSGAEPPPSTDPEPSSTVPHSPVTQEPSPAARMPDAAAVGADGRGAADGWDLPGAPVRPAPGVRPLARLDRGVPVTIGAAVGS